MTERGVQEIEDILGDYVADPKSLSRLSLQLYEVCDVAKKYIGHYEKMFGLPSDPSARREVIAETLTAIMVLMEDMEDHVRWLREETRSSLDTYDEG